MVETDFWSDGSINRNFQAQWSENEFLWVLSDTNSFHFWGFSIRCSKFVIFVNKEHGRNIYKVDSKVVNLCTSLYPLKKKKYISIQEH